VDGRLTRRVEVAFTKWDGSRHWEFATSVLGEDAHGIWLWVPEGTALRRGLEPPRAAGTAFVKLIRPDGWWTAEWNARSKYEVYVDIATPARWDADRVTMIDLDLDVVRLSDGSVALLDEDEFLEHAGSMAYPASLVDTARAAAASVHLALSSGEEPFGSVGRDWLAAGHRRGAGRAPRRTQRGTERPSGDPGYTGRAGAGSADTERNHADD
jgi:hypothetical protein